MKHHISRNLLLSYPRGKKVLSNNTNNLTFVTISCCFILITVTKSVNGFDSDQVKVLSAESNDDGNRMENNVNQFHRYGQEFHENDDDNKCLPGFWWHLRGERCVPEKCLGGNKFRDRDTGECIRKSWRKFKGRLNNLS